MGRTSNLLEGKICYNKYKGEIIDMDNKTYTQQEFLTIMQTYNTLDRKTIKHNLKEIKAKYKFENADIFKQLEFNHNRVVSWFNYGNPNIPTFIDLLTLAAHFGFSIEEVVQTKEIQD